MRKRVRIVKKPPSDISIVLECRYCHSKDVVVDRAEGNLVCRSCARVSETHQIDYEREWMEYEKEKGQTGKGRGGAPEDRALGHLGMTTGFTKSKGSRELSKSQRKTLKSKEKSLKRGLDQIRILCNKINLSKKYITSARDLFRQLWDKNALRGKKHQVFYATCIYIACKLEGSARTLAEIVALTRVQKSDIRKVFQSVRKTLKLNSKLQTAKALASRSQNVLRFCSFLKFTFEVSNVIEHACSAIDELSRKGKIVEFQGKNPDTISSAVIYMVSQMSNEKRTAGDISEVTGKAASTIVDTCSKIKKYKKLILPEEFLKKYDKNGK